jgi:hypothetical protein
VATAKGVAAEKKAAAARAESNGQLEPIKFRGIDLKLMPKLPLSVVGRASVLRDDDVPGIFRTLEAILGREQYQLVMDKLDDDSVDVDNEKGIAELGDILSKALEAYGLTPGESQASQDS